MQEAELTDVLAPAPAPAPAIPVRRSRAERSRMMLYRYAVVLVFVAMIAVFSGLLPHAAHPSARHSASARTARLPLPWPAPVHLPRHPFLPRPAQLAFRTHAPD